MPTNVIILVVAIAGATLLGLWFRRYNGHFRGAARAEMPIASSHPDRNLDVSPGVVDQGLTSAAPPAVPGSAPKAPDAAIVLSAQDLAADLGERATLLQFSSAFCAPCRATRRTLADVAAMVPGVSHVELDAESHLDLVRRLGVMRTPTTFVLDADGVIVSRASGAPGKAAALAALGHVIP